MQNFAEEWPRNVTHLLQIVAREQTKRMHLIGGSLGQEALHEPIGLQSTVAGKAVETVQFKVLVEARKPDKSFQRGCAHLCDILEAHVICDEGGNLFCLLVRES